MKKILLVRTDRIGDVALSTPVIKAIRKAFPLSYIAFMVRPYARGVVEGNPYLDEVIIYDKYGSHRGVLSTLRFAWNLRKKGFDTAIILHPTNRAHIVTFVAAIPERIGFDRKLAWLLTKAVKDEKSRGQKHELEYTLHILKEIGIHEAETGIHIPVENADIESACASLEKKGIGKSEEFVTCHPSSSCLSKRWPLERFARLIDRIRSELGLKTVLVAGPEERDQIESLKTMLKFGAVDLAGETSVGQLAALLKRSELFISNDSGPVHISWGVGTPSVVIFGRRQPGLSPQRWGPRGQDDIVIHKDAGCKICLAHNCKRGFRCLTLIAVDEVYEAVRTVLLKRGKEPVSGAK